jgi:hypothetical protein
MNGCLNVHRAIDWLLAGTTHIRLIAWAKYSILLRSQSAFSISVTEKNCAGLKRGLAPLAADQEK